MSSAYRYVVFASGKQPTVEEVAALKAIVEPAKCRYAVGVNGEDGALTFAFEARAFESTRSANSKFARLLGRWEVRGCEVRERLPFVKQPTALQPMPGSLLRESVERRTEPALKRKQLAAQEALGRAGLKFHQTLQHNAWLERVAQVVPYALMGMGGLLTIVLGVYLSQRLSGRDGERRQQTIERVMNNPLEESLAVPASSAELTAPGPADDDVAPSGLK